MRDGGRGARRSWRSVPIWRPRSCRFCVRTCMRCWRVTRASSSPAPPPARPAQRLRRRPAAHTPNYGRPAGRMPQGNGPQRLRGTLPHARRSCKIRGYPERAVRDHALRLRTLRVPTVAWRGRRWSPARTARNGRGWRRMAAVWRARSLPDERRFAGWDALVGAQDGRRSRLLRRP